MYNLLKKVIQNNMDAINMDSFNMDAFSNITINWWMNLTNARHNQVNV